ncbi:acetolactate synthase small subunit [Aliarcobacter cryaerophilus]|uniref:hypothetical protein n=1 Tax=Aliarcobacter cryaerophilus TaxID=28198 RepID=UPI0021B44D53|nr:hypothetical protein [Aliarcobacter cryaerophilus]MCT7508504.1 hypothetical protein [Aliarcobacter cryaerophilus]
MATRKSIIPEFMKNNTYDTFQFLFPLKIALDEDKYGNSHYEVVVKNITKNEVFKYPVSPELFFTHYQFLEYYKNGKKVDRKNNIEEKSFIIDSNFINENNLKKLKDLLDEDTIGILLGWNKKYLKTAENINCYLVEIDGVNLIIPHFAIGIYYYFRSSALKEAVLDSTLQELYILCDDNPKDAKIVLPKYKTDEDAAIIHRFACQKSAIKEFDNVSSYIHNYLKYMQEKNLDEDIYKMHLKFNFPTKEQFKIDTRSSFIKNKVTNEIYYFIHEIINDYSSIGFEKLTKYIQKNKIILNIDDIDNLPVIEREVPNETTEILQIAHADKKYTQTSNQKNRKKSCGSLKNIPVDESASSLGIIGNLLKIYKDQESDEKIDQSLTQSSSKGKSNIRRVVISTEFVKDTSFSPLNEIDNFVVFRQYIRYLEQRIEIKNLYISDEKELQQFTLDVEDGKKQINPKCKINKRARKYITVKFQYENSFVGLLELENIPKNANSTWVIISNRQVKDSDFNYFITLYVKDDENISDIIENHSKTNPKFTKKNHERNENLEDKQLGMWYVGLLGKIV